MHWPQLIKVYSNGGPLRSTCPFRDQLYISEQCRHWRFCVYSNRKFSKQKQSINFHRRLLQVAQWLGFGMREWAVGCSAIRTVGYLWCPAQFINGFYWVFSLFACIRNPRRLMLTITPTIDSNRFALNRIWIEFESEFVRESVTGTTICI